MTDVYLRNFAGFFLQIFPCMLFCILPFEDEMFRWPARKVYGAGAGFCLFASLVFSLANDLLKLWMNRYMMVAILLFSCFYFYVVRAERVKKLLVLIMVIAYAAGQYMAVNLILLGKYPGGISEPYGPDSLFLFAVTTGILAPLMGLFVYKGLRPYLAEMDPDNIGREIRLVLIIFTVFIISNILHAIVPAEIFPKAFWLVENMDSLLYIVMLILYCWGIFYESVRRRRESEYRRAMDIQQVQYESIARSMESDRRMRHDMRHHLNVLRELAQQGKTEELKGYLDDISGSAFPDDDTWYCQNVIVNSLLQYYAGMARDEGIRCDIHAQCGDLNMAPGDITVLLGNAMENAVYACRQAEGERRIRVQIGMSGDSLLIQIQNSCREVRLSGQSSQEEGFRPASAFASLREGGGYGLGSIDAVARRCNGYAQFRFEAEKKLFTTRIRLNF